jgi:hypothetical protein
MSSLGYSDFNNGGSSTSNAPGSDGYIASKRKNKTVKAIDPMTNAQPQQAQQQQPNGRTNPKLERLRASIAKIHAASSDEEDDNDANDDATASVLPTYPGSSVSGSGASTGLKVSPPIADAGSGNQASSIPPTTNEGRTHQPMFSMSQQFGSKMGMGSEGVGTGASGSAGVEQFKMNAPSTYAAQYYKQLAPYNYNKLSNELAGPGTNDEFIEKLNYIIHLLEEQHNERTEHVTEELVLYCFLGVFIIFIVDSFARAGKYTR